MGLKRGCVSVLCLTMIVAGPPAARTESLDPMKWLDKDSVPGMLYGQTVQAVGTAIATAAQVRKEAYERQMEIDFARKALAQCDRCPDEAALKARVDRLIAADEKLHRQVDSIAGRTGIAAALHILMDPTGQREQRYKRSLNFDNLIDGYCYVVSQKDEDARGYCKKSFSMEFLDNQAGVAWKFCKDALRTKYAVNNPENYPLQPSAKDPPDEARDFFISCRENSTVAYALMRKVAEVCALRYEDVRYEAPNFYKLIKTCNSDPGGPPGMPHEVVESARKLLATRTPGAAEEAYALFSRMAAKHHAPAMYHAGQALLTGNGVEKNEAAAFDLFTQAAVRGDQDAMVALALMYKNGIAVPQDTKSALRYLQYVNRQRIEGPAADASIVLARMYASGDGVQQNEQQAASLYREAASRQRHRRDKDGHVTTQQEHPEYSWEAANWLIDHKDLQNGMNILLNTDVPDFRFEAVKWYMKGWTGADGRIQPPDLKAASRVLRSHLLTDRNPEVRQQAQELYDTIPASAR